MRALIAAKGHAVDNAREAASRLEQAFADGALQRTSFLDQALHDLKVALEQDEGQTLGGKSAEASRFILRAIDRELDARLTDACRDPVSRRGGTRGDPVPGRTRPWSLRVFGGGAGRRRSSMAVPAVALMSSSISAWVSTGPPSWSVAPIGFQSAPSRSTGESNPQ